MTPRAILGLNQYTHSAAACVLGLDGEPWFATAKERLTRKKFDGGDVAELVECALEACGLAPEELACVVANNHLFRIAPFEDTLRWATALHQYRPSGLRDANLLPGVPHVELSHHLAHAWSVLPYAPFDRGLIVVMDGIGSALADVESPSPHYHTDRELARHAGFREVPGSPDRAFGWREAESAYVFDGLELRGLRKRWAQERTPTFLYNYGFENMDSLGAVYSRVSSHVFGDWNACGKVMGLAPWAEHWKADDDSPEWVMRGPLEELAVNWQRLHAEPFPNEWAEEDRRPRYARLAADLQRDLEGVVLEWLVRLREETGERHLCLAGGVALNSTLNGRIVREAGFDEVFLPSYPGDEGIAVGCAAFGLHRHDATLAPRRRPLSPFLGRGFDDDAVDSALADFAPWVEVEPSGDVVAPTADAIAAGQVVGWFQGRSEFGPRALGNRSILADPRPHAMIERINVAVKKRERFRPFAPSVLAARAEECFVGPMPSPSMSLTVPARENMRSEIAAVVHVDGSARLQTLEPDANPRYHALLEACADRTGLPLVLNTSFNVRGEPIVDSPEDALRTFLDCGLDLLVLEDRLVRARPFPSREEEARLFPRHESSFTAETVSDASGEPLSVRLMAGGRTIESDLLALGLLEAADGSLSLADLLVAFEEEYGEDPESCRTRLRELYAQRLLRLLPSAEPGPPE